MWLQVSENAKQDLKDGLRLYNTDNNIGLRNAWNIIQAEVCVDECRCDIRSSVTVMAGHCEFS